MIMAPASISSISSDSGEERTPKRPTPFGHKHVGREGRILLKMRNKLRRYPQYWAGDPFGLRDSNLLYGTSADFIDITKYMGTCHLARIAFLKPGEDIMRDSKIQWTSENDNLCKMIVSRCGGKANGLPISQDLVYPQALKKHHVKVDVKIVLSSFAATRYGVSWGTLSTRADKIQIFKGPEAFTPRHSWDAMIMHDCTVTGEGDLCESDAIASWKWDILLMKMSDDYSFPWLPVSIREASSFQRPERDPHRECYPCTSPKLGPRKRFFPFLQK
ncbi:uncharacterized protein F4807DRAFT_396161 [Annulohypoxylon truncatum]|uniref:uncharacterized protein n=1 Tax=Annulohypoxylon truncatum TaxID=327061 RepID=UPI002007B050|nr:uncharacterized protein F4807DRAFT_396161 [Annulohypoxylon truncatum]KAI1211610.1 hypothetical protein F4807DRAFT_396161 [Annulohypoxylon truncatum]